MDNGDVLDFVNQKYGTELTWDGIEVSSVEEIDEFWDKLLDVIQNLMNEFFRRVFLVNEAISPEFWKGVINAVTSICEVFAVLDDDDAMVEEDVAVVVVFVHGRDEDQNSDNERNDDEDCPREE